MSDVTLDVAIVGGGLCGLTLARSLLQQGRKVGLFEARTRLGGRIETAAQPRGPYGSGHDLGPTWFWPQTQPLMTRLTRELKLDSFTQHDGSEVLVQNHADASAQLVQLGLLHASARRVAGGMGALVAALGADLPSDVVQLDHVLTAVVRRGDQVELSFRVGDTVPEVRVVTTQRVVLALPPRLIAENVRFEPELDDAVRTALQNSATWMATQAKAVLQFERATWREHGRSGTAFALYPESVVKEVFDACEHEQPAPGALGAFIALGPDERAQRHDVLRAIDTQLAQLFQLPSGATSIAYRDWADEAFTCSALDRARHCAQPARPSEGALELRKAYWQRRLFFGGSETADNEAGYMEGALRASQRIARELRRADAAPAKTRARVGHFHAWLQERRTSTLEDYKRRVAFLIPSTDRGRLTQRALVGSVQQLFSDALLQLQATRDTTTAPAAVHDAVRKFLSTLVLDVLSFNRSASELSDLNAEQKPSQAYSRAILREVHAAYQRFSSQVTELSLPPGHNPTDPALALP